jgi:PBSX family phage terminase large subunit
MESTARLNVWEGAVRSGKTLASILRWLEFCADGPPGEFLMVGKTERTLRRNVLNPMFEILSPADYDLKTGSGELRIWKRKIYLASANDERSEALIRGLTLAGAYDDEITLNPESFFTMLLSRLSVPGAKFMGTTNPDSPLHWFKAKYLNRAADLNLRSFHFSLRDNPYLDPEYIAALEAEYTGMWRARYIDGLWTMAEGAIYDMWNPAAMTFKTLPAPAERYCIGIDYGTANPTAFLLLAECQGRLYVLREYYYDGRAKQRQKTDAEYAQDLKTFIGNTTPWAVVPDPSAASFIAQMRKSSIGPIRQADNSVLDGVRNVASWLTSGRLLVHESCTSLCGELASYVWDPSKQAKGEDAPLKENDHACDALRYALQTLYRRR